MNKPLTIEELRRIYSSNPYHIWAEQEPPYLYLENKRATFVALVSWAKIVRSIGTPNTFTSLDISLYGKEWRLWKLKPTEEDRTREKWR